MECLPLSLMFHVIYSFFSFIQCASSTFTKCDVTQFPIVLAKLFIEFPLLSIAKRTEQRKTLEMRNASKNEIHVINAHFTLQFGPSSFANLVIKCKSLGHFTFNI